MATSHPIVSVERELRRLKPSSELFDYYLKRMNTFVEYHDEMLDQINSLKLMLEGDNDYKQKFILRNGEVIELRNALSTMQTYVQEEREHALSLHQENDLLKMQLLKTQRKVDFLLRKVSISFAEAGVYVVSENGYIDSMKLPRRPRRPIQYYTNNLKTDSNVNSSEAAGYTKPNDSDSEESDGETRRERARTLVSDWLQEIQFLKDKIMLICQNKEVQMQEWELEVKQLQSQVSVLTDRLQQADSRLVEAIQQATKVEKELISKEVSWMKERNRVFICLEEVHKLLQTIPVEYQTLNTPRETDDNMIEQLTERDQRVDWWHNHCKSLESELEKQIMDKKDMESSYKSKIQKLNNYIKFLQDKLKEESDRRRTETEGFLSSVKMQRVRIDNLEKTLKGKSYGGDSSQ